MSEQRVGCQCRCICHVHNGKSLRCKNWAAVPVSAFCYGCVSQFGCKRKSPR